MPYCIFSSARFNARTASGSLKSMLDSPPVVFSMNAESVGDAAVNAAKS